MSGLAIGDVVVLNSGGPEMTVIDTGYDDGQVMCSWFVKNEEVKQQLFRQAALEKVS